MKKVIKKNQEGITLIALVITIIVLLILAGVAISMLSGENGILKQVANAKTETVEAEQKEQVALTIAEGELQKRVNKQGELGEVSKGSTDTTLIKSIQEVLSDEDYTETYQGIENKDTAVDYAKTNNNYIKLNKNVYIYEQITVDQAKTVVIDLNGNQLVYMGTGSLFKNSLGYIYIIDTSANKTGKFMFLSQPSNYVYNELLDVDKNGGNCINDVKLVEEAAAARITDESEDWELYKYCDFNGDRKVNLSDITDIKASIKMLPHWGTKARITLDVGEDGLVTKCGCNE